MVDGDVNRYRNLSVFINCPFDKEFEPIFDAIVFSIACCGFLPRSALESGSTSIPRMERITHAIRSSKYSIHDLSRCKGEEGENLARFNMPLELGISMAHRYMDQEEDNRHDWLLLVPRGHSYMKFVSDLAGYDPKEYDVTKESVVPAVMSWVLTRSDAPSSPITPTPKIVLDILPEFEKAKYNLLDEWKGHLPWKELITVATNLAEGAGFLPRN